MDATAQLSRVELFSALDTEGVAAVAAAARFCTFQRNDLVFSEGDHADDLYVVQDGRIAITIRSPDGRESVVALMEQDDLFGEMPFFDGEGRSADARALETAELLAVPYQALRNVLEERPRLLWKVTELMARRLRATDAALADSMFLDVTGRTATELWAPRRDKPLNSTPANGMAGHRAALASRPSMSPCVASWTRSEPTAAR
jgi:CRP-like cAMP-binding protein